MRCRWATAMPAICAGPRSALPSRRNWTSRAVSSCPERLRAYANIQSNVAVVGMNTFLELWDLDAWESLEQEVESQGDVFAAHLAGQF